MPSPDGGSVSVYSIQVPPNSEICADGDTIRFVNSMMYAARAILDEGHSFASWSVTEGTVTSDMTIEVTFKDISEISVSKSPGSDYTGGEMSDPADDFYTRVTERVER